MKDLNEQVIQATLNDHAAAGRTPVEAAGEVRFLEEVMAKHGIMEKETVLNNRRYIDAWLADRLGKAPEELADELQLAEEYARFLHERVETGPHQMPRTETAWREWRQAR